MSDTDLLTTSQAATIIMRQIGYGTAGTLKRWRHEGRNGVGVGPPYINIGRRGAVRYRRGDVDAWIRAQVPGGDGGSK